MPEKVEVNSSQVVSPIPKLAYRREEAALMLSISIRKLDELIACGELKARRIGTRVLIPYQSLVQFIRRDHVTNTIH
jgi:excisionase family DNA binding protein